MLSILDDFKSRKLLTAQQIEQLENLIVIKNIVKGDIILRKGETSQKAYYVKKGCLRCYWIDEKGKEHIFMFAPEGWIADTSIQFHNKFSDLFIDAIEDSVVEVLDRRLFEQLETFLPVFTDLLHGKLINRVAVLQKRIMMLMSATAWERYADFMETYPNIIQRVPQRMIASYIGITPEALSKLRGDFAKK